MRHNALAALPELSFESCNPETVSFVLPGRRVSHRATASAGLFGLPGINISNPMPPATAKAAP